MNDNLPLHLKYRPQKWEEIVGNKTLIESLKSVLIREKGKPHAFLLVGPSGCGKTTIGRIIRNELGCSDMDFMEYNSASLRGIDTIRELAIGAQYAPLNGKNKVYLLDEIHKATNDAQNALLKLLEEPSPRVSFILCTTDPEKLIKTVRTRCTTYQVQSLSIDEIIILLKSVCKKEGAELPENAYIEIARVSQGSARQALVVLDRVIDIADDNLLMQAIEDCLIGEVAVIDLCRKLMSRDWTSIVAILKGLDEEPENVRYAVLGYFSAILLNPTSTNNHGFASSVIDCFKESFMYSSKAGLVNACYKAIGGGNVVRR